MRPAHQCERLGEEVIEHRQTLLDFDRRRNGNREALAALRREESSTGGHPASRKHWVCLGDTFVRLPHAMVKARLEQDQGRLEKQIDEMRDGVKRKSAQICEIDPTMCVRACVRTRTASMQHHHAVRTRTASL